MDFFTSGQMLVNNFQHYQEMHRLSIESFKHNLRGDWDLIELSGEIFGLQQAFQHTMRGIRRIWHERGPCNILYTDCDTLCVKPLDLFGRYPEFRLFSSRPLNLDGHFNCGVRYYPATMDQSVWELQDLLMQSWTPRKYDSEQDIYNVMVWSQQSLRDSLNGIPQHDVVIHDDFSPDLLHEKLSGTHSIMHFLSAGHPKQSLNLMTKTWFLLNKTHKDLKVCS